MTQFLIIEDARTRAIERSQTHQDDAIAITYIDELLELSSAPDPQETMHYRPYWVAAQIITQDPEVQDVIKVDQEAEFTDASVRIASLLALQQAYDEKYELAIADAFEAVPEPIRMPVEGGTRSIKSEAVLW